MQTVTTRNISRDIFKLAYRYKRLTLQIQWAPDHVDPDDIDPAKFAPGGYYHNSPELLIRREAATDEFFSSTDPDTRWQATLAAAECRTTVDMPSIHMRLYALRQNRMLAELFGE